MNLEEQNIIKDWFDNEIELIDEFNDDVIKIDTITEKDFPMGNPFFGYLYYDSINFQYRILEEVDFINIKIKA
jgi:hypothetical protein